MFILPFLIGLVLRHQRPEPLRVLDSASADPDMGASAPAGRERCTRGASGVRAPGVPPRILQTIRRFVSRCGAVGAPHHHSLDSMRQHSMQCRVLTHAAKEPHPCKQSNAADGSAARASALLPVNSKRPPGAPAN